MERDVEKVTDRDYFVSLLRRVADSVEQAEAIRIQVAGHRFTIPADAEVSVEHEVSEGAHELEMQLKWTEE